MHEAQSRISSREFERWRALELVDPWWLPQRIDNAIARLCSVVNNSLAQKRSQMRGPDRYLPDYERSARRVLRLLQPGTCTPADELRDQFRAYTLRVGGKVQTAVGSA